MQDLKSRLKCDVSDELLRLAMTHPSAVGEGLDRILNSNQRLEFLGDGLVGAIVAAHLYESLGDLPEGALTSRKIAAVRREALASAAVRLGLGDHLIFGRGEEAGGGRKRATNLSDAFEALVAAIYLTSGWEKTREFVVEALDHELKTEGVALVPAKNRLQEFTQGVGLGTPTYKTGATSAKGKTFSSEVLLQDEVRGRGRGTTKKAAEEAAAEAAMAAMQAGGRE